MISLQSPCPCYLASLNLGEFVMGREDVPLGVSENRSFETWTGLFISRSCRFLEQISILMAFLVMFC